MVELLAGPLVGAAHVNKLQAKNWGNLVVAIHPRMLGDAATFYQAAGEVLERVRHAERLPGVDAIIIPGEREAKMAQARQAIGTVPIEVNMLNELRKMAASWDTTSASAPPPSASQLESILLPKLELLMSRLDRLEAAFHKLEAAKGGQSGLEELKEAYRELKRKEEKTLRSVREAEKQGALESTQLDLQADGLKHSKITWAERLKAADEDRKALFDEAQNVERKMRAEKARKQEAQASAAHYRNLMKDQM